MSIISYIKERSWLLGLFAVIIAFFYTLYVGIWAAMEGYKMMAFLAGMGIIMLVCGMFILNDMRLEEKRWKE